MIPPPRPLAVGGAWRTGSATSPVKGDWSGIIVQPGARPFGYEGSLHDRLRT